MRTTEQSLESHLTFEELRNANVERCHEVFGTELRDWSPGEWACAVAGECGEVCNAVKKLRRISEGTNTSKDPQTETEAIEAIKGEIADTIIYLDLLAEKLGIHLGHAICHKFNVVSDRMKSAIRL